MRQRELPVHKAVLGYLRSVLPPDCIVHHSPNGGARDARTGAMLKAMGTVAGFPDLQILLPGGKVLFMEIKASNGVASNSQRELWTKLQVLGFRCALIRSIDEARNTLRALDIQTRESAMVISAKERA